MSDLNRRPYLAIVVALAVAAGAGWARPDLVRQWGLELWHLPEQQSLLEQERHRERELADSLVQSDRRIANKERVAADLVAGRLTLAEAAARFRPVVEATPGALAALRNCYPGADEEECLRRNVICYAEAVLSGAPAVHREAVLRRLGQELGGSR